MTDKKIGVQGKASKCQGPHDQRGGRVGWGEQGGRRIKK